LVVNYFVIFFQNNVFIVDISYIWQRCPHGWPKATKFWAFSTFFKEIIFNWNLFNFCNTIYFFLFISSFYQIYLWGTYCVRSYFAHCFTEFTIFEKGWLLYCLPSFHWCMCVDGIR
jgi:hypothetical protein